MDNHQVVIGQGKDKYDTGSAYHESAFAPRTKQESAVDFLRRALNEHRQTHSDWANFHALEGKHFETDYQRSCVKRYDEMIQALVEISPDSFTRTVTPPRVG